MTKMIEISELKTTIWQASRGFPVQSEYEKDSDTFLLYFAENKEDDVVVTHYVDEYVFFLFRHSDNEIVGMGIEGFERRFAPAYANVDAWRLSRTGTQINGLKDFTFGVHAQENTSVRSHVPIRLVKKQEYDLSPEYAFA